MYDLAGFKQGAKEVATPASDYMQQLIVKTLSRYNCTHVNPDTIKPLLSASELQRMQRCECLYLGSYPLPPNMQDTDIEIKSDQDEKLNKR